MVAIADSSKNADLNGLCGPLKTRTRFILLIVVTLCMMINWANILAFNFTVICMGPKFEPIGGDRRSNDPDSPTNPNGITFTSLDSYLAQVAVAVAALVTNLPIIILVNKYGPRFLFTVLGVCGAVATALIPIALDHGLWGFYLCRAVQGIAFAGDMAVMGSFMAHWTYYKQNALFTATLCTYVQLAPIFTNPIAGILCESSLGWRAVYYLHAGVALVLFTIFFFTYRTYPTKHPWVGTIECSKIAIGRSEKIALNAKPLPYKQILKSLPFWAVLVGSIGNFSGVNLVYIGEPVYLNKVMGFQVESTGLMAAIPPLCMAVIKETSGFINDRLTFIPETIRTKIYNSIAFFTMSAFLIALGFVPTDRGQLAFLVLTIGYGFLGFNIGGFYKSGSLISRHHAPFVLGQVSNGITFTMLIVATIIYLFDKGNTQAQWRDIFLCVAAIMIIANVFYLIFASGEPQEWAQDDLNTSVTVKVNDDGNNNEINGIVDARTLA